MATKTPVSPQPLKDAIKELFEFVGDSSEVSEMLRDTLKAEVGGDEASGKSTLSEVSAMLWRINYLTKFIRTLGSYLPANSSDDQVLAIAERYKKIDYEQFSDRIYGGLCQWIHNEDMGSLACLRYTAETANIFQQVAELIEACERYITIETESIK